MNRSLVLEKVVFNVVLLRHLASVFGSDSRERSQLARQRDYWFLAS